MPQKRRAEEHESTEKAPRVSKSPSFSNDFSSCPINKAYSFIEPGPVLLVSTGSLKDSTHNLMTLGFHMMMQHESPPLIGITLGPWDASFATLKKTRECVLAVPSVDIAEKVVDIGNCSVEDEDDHEETNDGSGININKWHKFNLNPIPAENVQAPLVGGPHVLANIECVVEDMAFVEKYSMWVLRVVKAWESRVGGRMFHHRGQGIMVADGDVMDFKDRMVKWREFLED